MYAIRSYYDGEPIDGMGPLPAGAERIPIYRAQEMSKGATVVRPTEVLETGIKTIDFFSPLLRGGKMALVGGAVV